MIINLQKLLHLPVYTESDTKLGTIFDLEIDVDTHTVVRYFVRSNFLSLESLLIANSQVKAIKEDRLVVYDNAVKNFAGSPGPILEE